MVPARGGTLLGSEHCRDHLFRRTRSCRSVPATDVEDVVIDGDAVNDNFAKAARNIVGVNVLPAIGANVYDILKHDTLVLTRSAVEKLEARFNG